MIAFEKAVGEALKENEKNLGNTVGYSKVEGRKCT